MKEEEVAMKKAMPEILLMIARIKYLPEGLGDITMRQCQKTATRRKKINEKGHAEVNTAGDTLNLKELQKKKKKERTKL